MMITNDSCLESYTNNSSTSSKDNTHTLQYSYSYVYKNTKSQVWESGMNPEDFSAETKAHMQFGGLGLRVYFMITANHYYKPGEEL